MTKEFIFKKSIALVCAVLILILSFPTVSASSDDFVSRTGEAVDLRVGLFSDSHVVQDTTALSNALASYKTIDPNMMMALGGDIIYQNEDINSNPNAQNRAERYDKFLEVYEQNGFSMENTVYAMGNHEYVQNATKEDKYDTINAESKSIFTQKTGLSPNNVKTWNGYTFIAASPDSYSLDVSEETENWVLSEIAKAETANPGKPIFYLQHSAPAGSIYGSGSETENSAYFRNELKKYPNLIVLSGHTHTSAWDARTIRQADYTTVQSSVMSGAYMSYSGCINEGNIANVSYGLLLEMTGNVVTIYRLDFTNGAYIGEPFVIDVSDTSSWKYTDSYREENAKAPVFPASATVNVSEINGHGANVTFDSTAQMTESADDMNDAFVHSYNVKITNKATGLKVQEFKLLGDFWKADASQRTERTTSLTKLSRNTEYEVAISPLSSYQKEGTAITASFKTSNEKDETDNELISTKELNVALNKTVTIKDDYAGASGLIPAYLTDGNKKTQRDFSFSPGEYIQIDLEKRYPLKRIEITDSIDGRDSTDGRIYFNVLASNDASFATFDTIYEQGASEGNFTKGSTFTIDAKTKKPYRFIRIQKTNSFAYFVWSEIKVFADQDVTEVSRYKAVDTNNQYQAIVGAPENAVNGTVKDTMDAWIGDYRTGENATYNYLRVDLEKALNIGLIEMETRLGVGVGGTDPSARQAWTIFGANTKDEISGTEAIPAENHTKLYATGQVTHWPTGEYPFSVPESATVSGKLQIPFSDANAYRYVIYRNGTEDYKFNPEIAEVRAFVLNPMVNSVKKTGNTITVSFSDKMDASTLNAANIKVYDAAQTLQNITPNVVDEYTVTLETNVTGGKLVITDDVLNIFGTDLASDEEFIIENTGTDYSTKEAKVFANYNVAFHKPVTTNNAHATMKAEYLTDGVTCGSRNGFGAVAGDDQNVKGTYYIVDLERNYNVKSVQIFVDNTVTNQDGGLHHFKVSGSFDGVTYETIAEELDERTGKWNDTCYEINLPHDNNYRYIKWEKTNTSYFRLEEIKVFADVYTLKVTDSTNTVTEGSGSASFPGKNLVDGNITQYNFIYNSGAYPWASVEMAEAYPVEMVQIYRRAHGTTNYVDSKTAQMYVGVYGSNSLNPEMTNTTAHTLMEEQGYTKLSDTGAQDVFVQLYQNNYWNEWAFDSSDGYTETFENNNAYKYLTLKKTYGSTGNLQPSEFVAYVINPTLNKVSVKGNSITLEFSDKMIESLLKDCVTISDKDGNNVTITSGELSADKMSYTVAADLSEGEEYTVTVNKDARNQKGVPMQTDGVKSFVSGKIKVLSVEAIDSNGNVPTEFTENGVYTVKISILSTLAVDKTITAAAALKVNAPRTLVSLASNTESVIKAGEVNTVILTVTTESQAADILEVFAWEKATMVPLDAKTTF